MTLNNNKVWQAHAAILFANLAWALMAPVSKSILLGGAVSPLALSGIRILGGALLFAIVALFFPHDEFFNQKVRKEDWWKILLCSIMMISANQGLYIIGVGFTNPVDASVMSALTPILTMLLAAIFLRFPITWMKGSGVAIGLTGVLILVLGSQRGATASNPMLGDSLCFTAQLCAASYYVAFRNFITRYSPFTLMKWMFIISAVTYVPICIPSMLKVDFSALGINIWLELAYIICFATFLGYLAIPFAQKYLSPTSVSMYCYFQPVGATIASVMMGVGSFSLLKGVATLLIFAGVFFVNKSTSTLTPKDTLK
ncbi:MAG: DMT family transporter [Bacteroides sp.]|nr:DMT family transporter [Bacteroides sp.]